MITVGPHGFVELIDSMGNDAAIERAARVSYQAGTRSTRDTQKLIQYLYDHRHTSPFEHVEFSFRIRQPIFVARQWVRHRTASLNEVSARYSELPSDIFTVKREPGFELRTYDLPAQDQKNKQGRSQATVVVPEELFLDWENNAREAHVIYNNLLKLGVSRELARIHLPLSTYTEWVWKIDLHNLMHFLRLRLDAHAQEEIREFARAIMSEAYPVCPIAWGVFWTSSKVPVPDTGDWVGHAYPNEDGRKAPAWGWEYRHG